jgi:hypothetical protein
VTFKEAIKPKYCLPFASATTTRNGAAIDCRGYLGCAFVLHWGVNAAAATGTIKVQGSHDNSTWVDLDIGTVTIGAIATDISVIWDIVKPQHRYLRVVVARTNSESSTQGVLAYLYRASSEPVPPSYGVDPHVVQKHAPLAVA